MRDCNASVSASVDFVGPFILMTGKINNCLLCVGVPSHLGDSLCDKFLLAVHLHFSPKNPHSTFRVFIILFFLPADILKPLFVWKMKTAVSSQDKHHLYSLSVVETVGVYYDSAFWQCLSYIMKLL